MVLTCLVGCSLVVSNVDGHGGGGSTTTVQFVRSGRAADRLRRWRHGPRGARVSGASCALHVLLHAGHGRAQLGELQQCLGKVRWRCRRVRWRFHLSSSTTTTTDEIMWSWVSTTTNTNLSHVVGGRQVVVVVVARRGRVLQEQAQRSLWWERKDEKHNSKQHKTTPTSNCQFDACNI